MFITKENIPLNAKIALKLNQEPDQLVLAVLSAAEYFGLGLSNLRKRIDGAGDAARVVMDVCAAIWAADRAPVCAASWRVRER